MYGRIANRERVLAGAIDVGIVSTLVVVAAFAPSVMHGKVVLSFTAAFVGVVLAEVYSLLDAWSAGGTLGKRVVGLRIAREDGRPPTEASLVARWFIKFIPLHVLALEMLCLAVGWEFEAWGQDVAWVVRMMLLLPDFVALVSVSSHLVMFDDLRQSIHDVLTDTAVFDAAVNDPTSGFAVLMGEPVLPVAGALVTPGHSPGPPMGGSDRSDPRP